MRPRARGAPARALRLWDHLGELCLELEPHDDAVVAFEVALSLDPDNIDRRKRLADLYGADTKHDPKAIAQHQEILRANKRHLESYKALKALYERTRQPERARAAQDALDALAHKPIEDRIGALFDDKTGDGKAKAATRPLTNEDWLVLSRLDVDLQLSALFAVVAPPFAVERARMRSPASVPSKEHEVPPSIARAGAARSCAFRRAALSGHALLSP